MVGLLFFYAVISFAMLIYRYLLDESFSKDFSKEEDLAICFVWPIIAIVQIAIGIGQLTKRYLWDTFHG